MSDSIPIATLPRPAKPGCAGVYRLICTAHYGEYIGSSNNIQSRVRWHVQCLRRGSHHCAALQLAWNNWGEDAFEWDILVAGAPLEECRRLEQRYIDQLFGQRILLNSSMDVRGTPPHGSPSKETNEKRAAKLRGSRRTPEQCRRIAEARKAAGNSAANIARITELGRARRFGMPGEMATDAAARRRLGEPLYKIAASYGVTLSAFRRELYAKFPDLRGLHTYTRPAYLGRPAPEQPRVRPDRPDLAAANRARNWTPEARARASEAAKRRVAAMKARSADQALQLLEYTP